MIYARITITPRQLAGESDLPRLIEAVNYSTRMRRAGVPDKVRLKILRRWEPFPYFIRKEMRAVINDLSRRLT